MKIENLKLEISAKKSLGQNFLINEGILDKIVRAAELDKDDTVLEIGPGTGNLTTKLAEKAGRVIAVEKDRRLIEPLKQKFADRKNVEILGGDVLLLHDRAIVAQPYLRSGDYKIVGNIPYYITSHLLKIIFEEWSRPSSDLINKEVKDPRFRKTESGPTPKLIVLTVQKEVARRMMAKPPRMNLLALSVQYYAEPKIISYISRGSFRPMPKVDSAIIRLRPRSNVKGQMSKILFSLMRAGFAGKRKQLAGNLAKHLRLDREKIENTFKRLGLDTKVRAEGLALSDWLKIIQEIESQIVL